MAYARYMIFEWDEYDNPDPFDCVDRSFNNLKDAKEYVKQKYPKEEDLFCIFDRVEGVFKE